MTRVITFSVNDTIKEYSIFEFEKKIISKLRSAMASELLGNFAGILVSY